MNLIVAVDENWGIGKNNDLLFHVPEDMKFFRQKTLGKNVICGRKTLMSFPDGKPLPNRRHFVLTHSTLPESEWLCTMDSIPALLDAVSQFPEDDVIVIGGETVYRQLLPYCRLAFVTKIHSSDPEAQIFFPDLDKHPDFAICEQGERQLSKNGLFYTFLTYENKSL